MASPTRTKTTHLKTFTRPYPEAVTYDLSHPNTVLITLPPGSTWTSSPHWHETHTEYLQIIRGRALVTLGTVTREVGPQDGVVKVERGVVHEWRRVPPRQRIGGDGGGGGGRGGSDDEAEGELVVKEWTDPKDGQKEVFFRMLTSFLMEPNPQSMYDNRVIEALGQGWLVERYVVTLQIFVIFWEWDNWPVILGGGDGRGRIGWLGWGVTHVVLMASVFVGCALGLREEYREYVSEELGSRAGKQKVEGEEMEKGKKAG